MRNARGARARPLAKHCARTTALVSAAALLPSQAVYRTFTAPKLLALLAASPRRYFLVVRPHPAEPHDDFWRAAIADRYLSARVLVTREENLRDWLDACDVPQRHVDRVSEAALAGRPSLTLGTRRSSAMCSAASRPASRARSSRFPIWKPPSKAGAAMPPTIAATSSNDASIISIATSQPAAVTPPIASPRSRQD